MIAFQSFVRMRRVQHVPVLLNEVLAALQLRAGETVVDCTLGLGGHACELLRAVGPAGRLIGMDFDAGNIEIARANLWHVGENFSLHHTNFAGLPDVLMAQGVEKVDAILADVGVASPQIDDASRGFSYRRPGPLDMRMDVSRGTPASVLINRMSEKEIAAALMELGDETDGPKIAKLIVDRRKSRPIETTEDLMAIVCEARDFTLQRAAGAKLHPAARTFQALRMLVNRELPNLLRLMTVTPTLLKPGGRIAVISFHSGEDRIVKKALREGLREGIYASVSDDPVMASEEEIRMNPRSRSAKLRWGIRG